MPTESDKGSFVGCNTLFGLVSGLVFVGGALNGGHGLSKYFATILHGAESTNFMIPIYLFMVTGIFMICTAILGCYGAKTENPYLLSFYAALMGLTIVVQLSAVTIHTQYDDWDIARNAMNRSLNNYYNLDSSTQNESVQFWDYLQPNLVMGLTIIVQLAAVTMLTKYDEWDIVGNAMNKSLNNYNNLDSATHNESVLFWDYLQLNIECCGVNNYTDWINASQAPTIGFIPESCCKPSLDHDDDVTNCTRFITKENMNDAALVEKFIYVNGCFGEYFRYYSIELLALYAIFMAFVQIFGIVYACYLVNSLRTPEPGYRNLEPQIA